MATRKENTAIDQMQEDIQSLKYDNERIIKPAIVAINAKLDRDIYTPKSDFIELRSEVRDINDRTTNAPLVQKIVFGLVGMILVSVIGALIAIVVNKGGGS